MPKQQKSRVPRHVAVIMDGNGRWAKRRKLPRWRGHSEGAESVRSVVRACAESGVEELTLYAFSTENWQRPRSEVKFLMDLLRKFLVTEREETAKRGFCFRTIGRLERIPKGVRKELDKTVALCRDNTGMILRLALNYGGRQEIVDAARRLAAKARARNLDPDALTEDDVAACLYDEEMTDPDLLIRTGGEMRLSNFLLWELSYAELYFTRTCWPDFRAAHLKQAFRVYAGRQRRYGALKPRRTGRTRASARAR